MILKLVTLPVLHRFSTTVWAVSFHWYHRGHELEYRHIRLLKTSTLLLWLWIHSFSLTIFAFWNIHPSDIQIENFSKCLQNKNVILVSCPAPVSNSLYLFLFEVMVCFRITGFIIRLDLMWIHCVFFFLCNKLCSVLGSNNCEHQTLD